MISSQSVSAEKIKLQNATLTLIKKCTFSFRLRIVTNDRSEARVDPLAALLYKVKQANIKQRYRGQRRKGRVENRGRAMGQGRRQTERITMKQARSERQAANDQERRSTVQVVHGKTNWEIRSEM